MPYIAVIIIAIDQELEKLTVSDSGAAPQKFLHTDAESRHRKRESTAPMRKRNGAFVLDLYGSAPLQLAEVHIPRKCLLL